MALAGSGSGGSSTPTRGVIGEGSLPDLLRHIYVSRLTGLLYFSLQGRHRSLLFRQGHIVRAATDMVEERLGETLVAGGRLAADDLSRATAIVLSEKKRLGVVLEELGLMDRPGLEEALALRARQILARILAWQGASYGFEQLDDAGVAADDVTLRISTGDIILDASRQLLDDAMIETGLGNPDNLLQPSTDPLLRFQRITLNALEGFIFSQIDGVLSVREVLQIAPGSPSEARRALYGLLCTGVVEVVVLPASRTTPRPAAPPPAAPPSTRAQDDERARIETDRRRQDQERQQREREQEEEKRDAERRQREAKLEQERQEKVRAEAAARAAQARRLEDEARRQEEAARTGWRQEIVDLFAGLGSRNHFEVLGLEVGAADAEVKQAYFKAAKRFHPDVHHGADLADLRDKLEAIFVRLGEAYDTLRDRRTREDYIDRLRLRARPAISAPPGSAPVPAPAEPAPPDPEAEALAADEAIRRAERLVAAEKFWDAIQVTEAALPRADSRTLQRGRMVLARAYGQNPNWIKRSEEYYQLVVHDVPAHFAANMALGALYRDQGLRTRALSHFRRAAQARPDDAAAAAAVRELAPPSEEPEPEEKGGLLKKLFGKGN